MLEAHANNTTHLLLLLFNIYFILSNHAASNLQE